MMRSKAALLCVVLLLAGFSAFARGEVEEAGVKRPVIKVASNVQIPMRIYFEGEQIKGYEYEIYREALNRAGYDTYVVDVAFAGIFAGLQAEKWSIAASNIFITAARAQEMDYSDPYLESFDCIIIRKGDTAVKALADLRGKVVGTELGTTQAAYAAQLESRHGPFQIRGFEDLETQFLDLEAKRIDALTLGYPTAVSYIKERQQYEILATSEDNFMIGAFFRKGDPLRDKFNQALNAMKRDGTIERLYREYFGQPVPPGSAPTRIFTELYVPAK